MNEGGQSSTGQVVHSNTLICQNLLILGNQLIDFIITTHPAYEALNSRSIAEGKTKFLGMVTSCLVFQGTLHLLQFCTKFLRISKSREGPRV